MAFLTLIRGSSDRAVVCYVSLNPVRARLVARAEEWPWSSVRALINGTDDGLVTVRPVLDRIPHFAELLSTTQDQDFQDLRLAEGSGRPLGTAEFVSGLERLLGRRLTRRAPGRKPAASVTGEQLKLLQ
jgi:putative transposase